MPFREVALPFMPPLADSLQLLSRLSGEQFTTLEREIRGPDAFRRDQRRAEELRLKLNLKDARDALGLLTTAKFFYDRSQGWAVPGEDSAEAMRSFLISTELWSELGSNSEATLSRVLALTGPNVTAKRKKKREWLRTGLLPNAVSFASLVDLRPNFTSKRDAIEESMPVIIFGIDIDSANSQENSFVFQVSLAGLRQLERVVEDERKKLEYLKASYKSSLSIVSDDE